MRNALLLVVASVCGAVAGVVATRAMGTPTPAPLPPAVAQPTVVARPVEDTRVATLQAQVRGMQQRLDAPQAPTVQPLPEQRAEREREANADHEAALLDHEREAREPAWANARERSLTDHLEGISGKVGMTVAGVDCRAHTCVARLRWSDMNTARSQLPALLDETALSGCARRIQLPETGAAPYEAQMLMDCPR